MPLQGPELIARLRERDGDFCYICDLRMNFNLPRDHPRAPTVDHVIPRAAGGTNRLDNKRLAHYYPCNQRKGAVYEGVDYEEIRIQEGNDMPEPPVKAPSESQSELVWSTSSSE